MSKHESLKGENLYFIYRLFADKLWAEYIKITNMGILSWLFKSKPILTPDGCACETCVKYGIRDCHNNGACNRCTVVLRGSKLANSGLRHTDPNCRSGVSAFVCQNEFLCKCFCHQVI